MDNPPWLASPHPIEDGGSLEDLITLLDGGPCTFARLVQGTGRSRECVEGMIACLHSKGLVVRSEDAIYHAPGNQYLYSTNRDLRHLSIACRVENVLRRQPPESLVAPQAIEAYKENAAAEPAAGSLLPWFEAAADIVFITSEPEAGPVRQWLDDRAGIEKFSVVTGKRTVDDQVRAAKQYLVTRTPFHHVAFITDRADAIEKITWLGEPEMSCKRVMTDPDAKGAFGGILHGYHVPDDIGLMRMLARIGFLKRFEK